VYTVFGVTFPTTGSKIYQNYLFNELEQEWGATWDFALDPDEMARKMIAHIDKKRKALGIDRARARIMVDMASRRALETA
jgi:carbon-monoxide dehydrogenase catalytic subunit